MPLGAYTVQNAVGYNDVGTGFFRISSTYRHIAMRVTFTQNIKLVSVGVVYQGEEAGSTAPLHQLRIYKTSDSSLVSSQNLWLNNVVDISAWQEHAITTVVLDAGVEYSIGFQVPLGYNSRISCDSLGTGTTGLAGQSTPAGITTTWKGLYYDTSPDTMPVTSLSDSLNIQMYVDPNALPLAPTGVSPVTPVTVGSQISLSWTHNDPDADPQGKYQVRYRKV